MGSICQEYRNDRATTLDKFTQKRIQFLTLPGSDAIFSYENCCGLDLCNLIFQELLPGQPGAQFPDVKPGQDTSFFQPLTDLLDCRLVLAVVTQKDVEIPLGNLSLEDCCSVLSILLAICHLWRRNCLKKATLLRTPDQEIALLLAIRYDKWERGIPNSMNRGGITL